MDLPNLRQRVARAVAGRTMRDQPRDDLIELAADQAARIAQLTQTLHHRTRALHRLVAKAADQDTTITALQARNRELEENQA